MAIIGQFDAFPYTYDDYYVYVNPDDGRLNFLPWGMDETFVRTDYWLTEALSVLPNACQLDVPCLLQVVDEIWSVLDLMEEVDLVAEVDAVAVKIAPYVSMDTRRSYDDMAVAAAQDELRVFLAGRRDYVSSVMPPPSYVP
jgi:hypothetical protein